MTLRILAPLALVCAALVPSAAAANTATCADSTLVTRALMERFGEVHAGDARSSSDEVLAIYSNTTNRTWTILLTLPDRNLSCLVASGTGEGALSTQLASLGN